MSVACDQSPNKGVAFKQSSDMGVAYQNSLGIGVVSCEQSLSNQIDAELEVLIELIAQLPAICEDSDLLERHFQQYSQRLDNYQEQPHLLEPIVAQLLAALLAHVGNFSAATPLVHTALKYVAHLVKVRGAKVLVRRFPHETDDVLMVLEYLERQKPDDCGHWETRYVLLLWLSMLVMTPFAMSVFDDGESTPITTRIFSAVEVYLGSVDKCQQASALVLAKFLTRPDLATTHLSSFVDKLFQRLAAAHTSLSEQLGILQCLSAIFKHGRRSDLLPIAATALGHLLQTTLAHSQHVRARKLTLKLLHRIGLAFLPSHAAKWRYQRGKRSLAVNLLTATSCSVSESDRHIKCEGVISSDISSSDMVVDSAGSISGSSRSVGSVSAQSARSIPVQSAGSASARSAGFVSGQFTGDSSESSEPPSSSVPYSQVTVPEQIEDVIENIIVALKDPDTIVRWTAAKGIGRIAGRLSSVSDQFCDDVVDCVLDEAFRVGDSVAAWHGGCLALAELSRRGVLTLSRLPAIIPLLLRALTFDQVQGSYAVGAAVRDAACYVCWALARAFEPSKLRQHVMQIAPALLCMALFDREVGCRRAAAAAFQENVGRQGTFPHGISIISNVDYFTVGNRSACFTKLSVFVAGFTEYTRPLMGHLLENKVCHWDVTIRELAAKALHNLTACDPGYAGGYVCDVLRSGCGHTDLATRHGSIMALGHVVLALSNIKREDVTCQPELSSIHGTDVATDASNVKIGVATVSFICSLHALLHQRSALSGVGCELMYKALCSLIRCCCRAQLPIANDNTLVGWRSILDVCLSHVDDSVRSSAVEAVPDFSIYTTTRRTPPLSSNNPVSDTACAPPLLEHYLQSAAVEIQAQRRGYCLALGALPASVVRGHMTSIIDCLIGCCLITDSTRLWAECRRDAALALTQLCLTAGVDSEDNGDNGISSSNVGRIFDCLLGCLDDYSLDQRGDIGAWVREAGLVGLQRLTILLAASDSELHKNCAKTVPVPDSSPGPLSRQPLLSASLVSRVSVAVCQLTAEKIDRTRGVAGAALTALLTACPPVPHIPERLILSRILQLSARQDNTAVSESDSAEVKIAHADDTRQDITAAVSESGSGEIKMQHTEDREKDISDDDEDSDKSANINNSTTNHINQSQSSNGCYGNESGGRGLAVIDWCQERAGLQCAGKLLALPVYHDHVLLTLLLAAGSVGERLATAAQSVICEHLSGSCTGAHTLCTQSAVKLSTSSAHDTIVTTTDVLTTNFVDGDHCSAVDSTLVRDRCFKFARVFVRLWSAHLRHGRVTVALMRALPPILISGVLDDISTDASLACELLSLCRREISRCADIQKLLAGVELLCALLDFWWSLPVPTETPVSSNESAPSKAPATLNAPAPSVMEAEPSTNVGVDARRSILHTLTILLCHRYPRVRRSTAQSLYESLLTSADPADGVMERVQTMLADTEWADELDMVRPVRDQIREALRLTESQRKLSVVAAN